MNIWMTFFLVVSVVTLAFPLVAPSRKAPKPERAQGHPQGWAHHDLELDLASGRLAREDFETMIAGGTGAAVRSADSRERKDGSLSEG